MAFLSGLRRAWVSIDLPVDNDDSDAGGTYFAYAAPPPFPGVTGWDWLREAPVWPESAFATPSPFAATDLTDELPAGFDAPADLHTLRDEPGLRERWPSATDAYFDLGDHLVPVEGGSLLHLVSDSQWVCHWLLYRGDEGEAVLATEYPAGMILDEQDTAQWSGVEPEYVICAESLVEFAWRWWRDHGIFLRVVADGEEPDTEDFRYLDGYSR